MKRLKLSLPSALLAAVVCGFAPTQAAGSEWRLAPHGDDRAAGTADAPLASLHEALQRLRTWRQADVSNIDAVATIRLAAGDYPIRQTVELRGRHSRVEICREGPGPVRLLAGTTIPGSAWRPAAGGPAAEIADEIRSHVLQVDLAALGVGPLPELPPSWHGAWPAPELYFGGKPMTPARWPNEGWAEFDEVVRRDAVDASRGAGGTIVYAGPRPDRWNVERGAWLHGYWSRDWADEVLQIAEIDLSKKRLALAAKHRFDFPEDAWLKRFPRRYYAVHVLAELDAPGEWWLDRTANVLYFYPPGSVAEEETLLSDLDAPIVTVRGAAHVTLRGLTLEGGHGDGFDVRGCRDVVVAQCTVRNLGGYGAVVRDSFDCRIERCQLHQLGRGGVDLDCGVRKTLVCGNCSVLDCRIREFGRLQRTYAPGVRLHGVGNRVAHNEIAFAPHSAVIYGGNEHVIELNEVHHVALETSDVGAIYTGRDWASRGNVVRHNFIHHLTSFGQVGAMGVYLDDCDSGDTIAGNVFYRASRATFIGGGRDNLVRGNVFVACRQAIHADARGLTRTVWDDPRDSWNLLAKAERVGYRGELWRTRYPLLHGIMEDDPMLPKGNVIEHNVAVGCDQWLHVNDGMDQHMDLLTFRNNLQLETDQLDEVGVVEDDQFTLQPRRSLADRVPVVRNIPFHSIGPR